MSTFKYKLRWNWVLIFWIFCMGK